MLEIMTVGMVFGIPVILVGIAIVAGIIKAFDL